MSLLFFVAFSSMTRSEHQTPLNPNTSGRETALDPKPVAQVRPSRSEHQPLGPGETAVDPVVQVRLLSIRTPVVQVRPSRSEHQPLSPGETVTFTCKHSHVG